MGEIEGMFKGTNLKLVDGRSGDLTYSILIVDNNLFINKKVTKRVYLNYSYHTKKGNYVA